MRRIRLIHWNVTEGEERAEELRAAGYAVDGAPLDGAGLRRLRDDPPDAVVIDLDRRPSQGRDLGLTLRKYAATRHVPLVFVGGAPDKVDGIRAFLPDAVYTTWPAAHAALERAIADPPVDPVVPGSVFDVYAGTPLHKKLGIREGSTVALVDAPVGFEDVLGELPKGATVRRRSRQPGEGPCDVTLWFVRSREELERRIGGMGDAAEGGGLWIVWPKQSSPRAGDLTQPVVRRAGLASGLVDFKICSVDATWTGLRFSRRKSP